MKLALYFAFLAVATFVMSCAPLKERSHDSNTLSHPDEVIEA